MSFKEEIKDFFNDLFHPETVGDLISFPFDLIMFMLLLPLYFIYTVWNMPIRKE